MQEIYSSIKGLIRDIFPSEAERMRRITEHCNPSIYDLLHLYRDWEDRIADNVVKFGGVVPILDLVKKLQILDDELDRYGLTNVPRRANKAMDVIMNLDNLSPINWRKALSNLDNELSTRHDLEYPLDLESEIRSERAHAALSFFRAIAKLNDDENVVRPNFTPKMKEFLGLAFSVGFDIDIDSYSLSPNIKIGQIPVDFRGDWTNSISGIESVMDDIYAGLSNINPHEIVLI